ncbi:aldo/keto reductase, partial [Amycolatopsis sp. lyj-346]|uniref:aldo/keto reductase n=1 Tax=Amycolatopsis sp. lyj-346 TaxID=2789289 RepID=UPI00397A006C
MLLDSYITLGRSGLRVSPLTLGTMTFGEDAGWGSSPTDSANILAAYLDRGGNHIDTANIYTNGHSEKIIGDYFAGRSAERDRVVIGTKFFANLHPGDP